MPASVTVTGSLGDGPWETEAHYGAALPDILPVTMDLGDNLDFGKSYGTLSGAGNLVYSTHEDKLVEDYALYLSNKNVPSPTPGTAMIYETGFDETLFSNNCVWVLYFGFYRFHTLSGNGNCLWIKQTGNSPLGRYELVCHSNLMTFTTQPSLYMMVA